MRVLHTAQETGALWQAQSALRISEDRCRRILEAMHEGCCVLAADSTISYVNSRLCSMLGMEPEEMLGRLSVDVFGPAPLRLADAEPRSVGERDVALRRKDGSVLWARVSGTPMLDDDGRPTSVVAMFSDVTARRQSEERAQTAAAQIEDLTADAIYTVDAQRHIWSWNRGAEKLFGFRKEEVIGRSVDLIPPERLAHNMQGIERILRTGATLTRETVRLHRDGTPIQVLGSWSPVPLGDGSTGVLCILKNIDEHKAAHNQLQEQARSLALLRERERIAMDLHDGVTQSLYGIALSLGALRRRRGDPTNQDQVLGQAIDQLTEVIQGIRDYIFELRHGVPEGTDLEAGLEAKARELAITTGVRPKMSITADLRSLSPERASHLLYIAHEALSNVARHAKASEIAIEAAPWRSGIMLTIKDNGRGFEPRRRGRRAGDGLRNMRRRAAQLGARLSIHAVPGAGTTVRVQVP